MKPAYRLIGCLTLLMLLADVARAQAVDEIYDPAPPADAAFVRWIHAAPALKASQAKVGSATLGAKLNAGEISPYVIVKQGKATIVITTPSGPVQKEFVVVAGRYYTLALRPGTAGAEVQVLEDPASTNMAKAQIFFYNLSRSDQVLVRTADLKTQVFPKLAQQKSNNVKVNPVSVELALCDGDAVIAKFPRQKLVAASSYSVIAYGDGEKVLGTFARNTTRR